MHTKMTVVIVLHLGHLLF